MTLRIYCIVGTTYNKGVTFTNQQKEKRENGKRSLENILTKKPRNKKKSYTLDRLQLSYKQDRE